MLFNNSHETLKIECCSQCKKSMQFPVLIAVFLKYLLPAQGTEKQNCDFSLMTLSFP